MTVRTAMIAMSALAIGLFAQAMTAVAVENVPLPKPRPAYTPTAAAATDAVSVELPSPPPGGYKGGTVIIMRGLHNIWSRGMDELAKKFEAQGVEVTLDNHSRWQKHADKIIADAKAGKDVQPVILIGHSLGGDAALVMSNWLVHNGVPVEFVVVYDAVAQTHPVDYGVNEVLNFYKPKGYGQEVVGSKRFKGKITNIDLTEQRNIKHLNIDKNQDLQDQTLVRSLEILKADQMAGG